MRQFFLLLLTFSFALPAYARPQSGYYTNPELDELRIELDDLKHLLKTTQVELTLLDERFKKRDTNKSQMQATEANSLILVSSQISALEKKVTTLEKTLEKAATDLRTLSTNASQALSKIQNIEQDLVSHEKRLDEVAKLKGTLTTISKAISQKPTAVETSSKSHRVKAGDSLEKIARQNHVSVDALRKTNNLSNDKIVVGQELRIPDEG
ncbi:MAG: LysM peptidoglycan-binding domain-containing protein [Candidatus Melainabacteria bacterium]|nr:LysM peptidoglycan-binding domain-containing protein [Candidatus Melainabacteria bacterium]